MTTTELKVTPGKWFDVTIKVPHCTLAGANDDMIPMLAQMLGRDAYSYVYWNAFVYPNTIEYKFERVTREKINGLSELFRKVCDMMPEDMRQRCTVTEQNVEDKT